MRDCYLFDHGFTFGQPLDSEFTGILQHAVEVKRVKPTQRISLSAFTDLLLRKEAKLNDMFDSFGFHSGVSYEFWRRVGELRRVRTMEDFLERVSDLG